MRLIHDSYLDTLDSSNRVTIQRTFDRLYRYMSADFFQDFLNQRLARIYLDDTDLMIIESQWCGGPVSKDGIFDTDYTVATVRIIDAQDYRSEDPTNWQDCGA